MNRKLHSFVSILMIFVLLWNAVWITTEQHTDDLEKLFWENEEEFQMVADKLIKILLRDDVYHCTYIVTEPYDIGPFVEQIGSLYFYTLDSPFYPRHPKQDYYDMYDAVEGIILSLDLFGITVERAGIEFCVSMSGDNICRIFYVPNGAPLNVDLMEVKEKTKICDSWYAVITYD